MIYKLLFVLALFCLPAAAEAATCAASATNASIQACLTSIATSGDTITVPAGTVAITSQLTVSGKSFTLQSVTPCTLDVNGRPTACSTTLSNQTGTNTRTLLATGIPAAGTVTITGFTFDDSLNTSCNNQVYMDGANASVHVHHNWVKIYNCNDVAFSFNGYLRGVVDHNRFESLNASNYRFAVRTRHTTWQNVGQSGDKSWAVASTMGNLDAMYFEDNLFTHTITPTTGGCGGLKYMADDDQGSRTVYRFNTFTNGILATHGTETDGFPRGMRHQETYRNIFTNSIGDCPNATGFRGGTGRVWDNVLTTSGVGVYSANTNFSVTTIRQDEAWSIHHGFFLWGHCGSSRHQVVSITRSGTTATVTFNFDAHAIHNSGSWMTVAGATGVDAALYNGTFTLFAVNASTATYTMTGTPSASATGTLTVTSPFDGNTNSTGYRCTDQGGAGFGNLVTRPNPASGLSISPIAPLNQVSDPIYTWNDTINGSLVGPSVSATDIIVNDRDIFKQVVGFIGASGIGRGFRSARPATCTTGVAYFSTDGGGNWNTLGTDGGLDKCTTTNTWTNDWYVPPTYPHPLQGGGADVTPPAVPTGVTVTQLVED